jgi:hypothetical protein
MQYSLTRQMECCDNIDFMDLMDSYIIHASLIFTSKTWCHRKTKCCLPSALGVPRLCQSIPDATKCANRRVVVGPRHDGMHPLPPLPPAPHPRSSTTTSTQPRRPSLCRLWGPPPLRLCTSTAPPCRTLGLWLWVRHSSPAMPPPSQRMASCRPSWSRWRGTDQCRSQ